MLKSIFPAVTAPSLIALVVTVSFGKSAPFNKSALVIFLVVEVAISTIAISSPDAGVVLAGSWLILGIVILLYLNIRSLYDSIIIIAI